MRNAAAATLVALALAACAPLQKADAPTAIPLGRAEVLSGQPVTVATGENKGRDMALGYLGGGIGGLIITAQEESTLGQATKYEYRLRMADGSIRRALSFSVAAPQDCVLVSRLADAADVILERTACGSR